MRYPMSYAYSADFNPLSPHGERPYVHVKMELRIQFQSTLPAWGETGLRHSMATAAAISIHSPRMGRDAPNFLLKSPL